MLVYVPGISGAGAASGGKGAGAAAGSTTPVPAPVRASTIVRGPSDYACVRYQLGSGHAAASQAATLRRRVSVESDTASLSEVTTTGAA